MYVPVTGDFAIDPRNVPLAVQANTFASCLKRGGNGNIVPTGPVKIYAQNCLQAPAE